jgi:hypothetical protein
VADLTARGLVIDPAEAAFVGVSLDVVSTSFRDAAGSPISETTSTITIEGEPDQRLRLPGQPVTAVTDVLLDGKPVTDWRLRSGNLWRHGGWSFRHRPSEVEVTYTHGLPTVPSDIVDQVCRFVAAALVAFRSEPDGTGLAAVDIRTERIGDYSVGYGDTGLMTDVELPDYLRRRLAARFGGGIATLKAR